jgi:purine nucleosidase
MNRSRLRKLSLFTHSVIAFCLSMGTLPVLAQTQAKRLVIADQDTSGPGGSDMASLLVLLQAPQVQMLGITVVTGDMWRDEEVAHALRLLETVGRTDVKVYPGAVFPLVRTQEWTHLNADLNGKVTWMGAWRETRHVAWDEVPPLDEGTPVTRAAEEDAAHFMVRMVHQYPHQVTLYAVGPLTNVALAQRLDPHFAELAQELVVMGGSLSPKTEAHEWYNLPRHEFNFWFDPEAASIVLNAPWLKITVTTVDASIQTKLSGVLEALKGASSPAAQYLVRYARHTGASDFAWDELAAAAWLDPAIIQHERQVYMDVNISRGPGYGDTLTWSDYDKPILSHRLVHAQMDVDAARLEVDLKNLLMAPPPNANNPRPLPPK